MGLLLSGQAGGQELTNKSHTLAFSTQDRGEKLELTRWGLDTAVPDPNIVRRGILYTSKDLVDLIRVSFPVNVPLVGGDLPASKNEHFQVRLEMAKMAGNKPFTMLPDTEGGVNPWYKSGREIIPERWVQLMAASQKRYGKKLESLEPFNEADYGWGQGSVGNLNDIMGEVQKSPDFAGVQLSGPSTLNADAAASWYQPIKSHLQQGTTHSLGGSFDSYVNFYKTARADGKAAYNPEVHNLVEVIAGAQYGLQTAIWWLAPELARGEFVKASHGVRLSYAEDRPRWSAAAVYRAPSGKVQAFLGSSERMGQTTSYRFVSRDRPVFFNGEGPRRDYTHSIRKDTESLINITWGQDVPPPIGGKYVIVNRASGKVLGVVGANQNNGAAIQQMDYSRAANQQWEVAPISTSYGDQSFFVIRAVHSGKVLDDTNWSQTEGSKIQQWGDGDAAAQHWFFDYAGNNNFYIRSRWSTKYLQAENASKKAGAAIVQTARTGTAAQQWRLIPASAGLIDFSAPQKPTGLKASPRPLAVALTWTSHPEADLASYTIFRSTTASGPYDTIARNVKGKSFIDNEATAGQKYFYAIKAVDHCLNQSTFSAQASAMPTGGRTLALSYAFNSNAGDSSGNANQGMVLGAPTYGVGRTGSMALVLGGSDDYVRLPVNVVNSADITIAAWVYAQAGGQWQRIFDFGNDESQYLFLTPNSGDNTLRLVARNGGEEQRLDAPRLSENQWVHVAVTLSGKTARLYVDGKQVASSQSWNIKPSDFKPVFNYIGKSQFAIDPLFQGRIDDFQIYNHALTSAQIAALTAKDDAK